MTTSEIRKSFYSLSDSEKVHVLLSLAARLTVFARDTYVPGTEEIAEPARLRRLNELQHRLLFHMLALTEGRTKRYPDEVVLSMVLEDYPHDWPELGAFVRSELSEALSQGSPS